MMLLYIIVVLQLLSLTGASESGIEGGHESKAHSRPYMASLQVNGEHVCGGILIREDFVLTAAHCKKCIKGTEVIMVVLGAHDLNNPDEKTIQQKIPVAEYRYHKHPSYNCSYKYDIMLLKLKTKAKVNKIVKTIGLAAKDEEIIFRTECLVVGWGKTSETNGYSKVLNEAKVKIEFSDECSSKWEDIFTREHMICTHVNKTAKTNVAIWQGDSGGPLICGGKVLGISSFIDITYRWNTAKYRPNVFMKVPFFIHWIETVMKW